MDDFPNIPRIASLLADPARARIVWTLIDGTTRPAGELAYAANISAQSASAHLAKLVDGGLLDAEAQGRHRYFRIASADIAAMLEGIASVGAGARLRRPPPAAAARAAPVQFLHARTCYGHLAGEIAVTLLDALVARGWVQRQRRSRAVNITPAGRESFQRVFGVSS